MTRHRTRAQKTSKRSPKRGCPPVRNKKKHESTPFKVLLSLLFLCFAYKIFLAGVCSIYLFYHQVCFLVLVLFSVGLISFGPHHVNLPPCIWIPIFFLKLRCKFRQFLFGGMKSLLSFLACPRQHERKNPTNLLCVWVCFACRVFRLRFKTRTRKPI